MSKEENAHLKKLSFVKIDKGIIRDLAGSNLLSNLRPSLKTLSIQNGSIRLGDARAIADCISGNDSALTKLELIRNINSDEWSTIMGAVATAGAVGSGSSSLQKLTLKSQRIDASKALAISDAIKGSHLAELSFPRCSFKENAAFSIMAAISASTIKTLVLGSDRFRKRTVDAIVDCIERSKLTKLSLYNISINDEVFDSNKMFSIVDAVQKSSLKTLDVRASQFCERTEDIISIIKFSSITKFRFDHCYFNPKASLEVINAIKGRSDFKNISMRHTIITDELLVKLCDLLENSSATQLDLSESDISEAQWLTIINSVCASSITSLIFETSSTYSEDSIILAMRNLLERCNIKKIKMHSSVSATMEALLPWIKQSSLIKFKLYNWSHSNKNVRATIKEILKEHRSSVKSSYRTKSARMLTY